MTASLRYWVIIPAAGAGERMGGEVPKQYACINNKTVLEASLSCFLRNPGIAGVIVVLHADDQYWNTLDVIQHEKIHSVLGGESRADSVFNAIMYLDWLSAEEQDHVLVHDAARPCLRYSDLERLMEQLKNEEVGGILGSPVSNTLKLMDDEGKVRATLDREQIWYALTPQMFRLKHLKTAMHHCRKQNVVVNDEASAIEALGLDVKVVSGHRDNIKITYTEDLALAEAILKTLSQ